MKLTKKQKVITELLFQGLSQQAMADKLGVSKNTIKTHINRMLKSTDTHTIGQYCGLYLKGLQEQVTDLQKKVEHYKRYKKMWEVLKLREYQEKRGY